MIYFEIYYLRNEEFYSLDNDKPFPLIIVGEHVVIEGKTYEVYKKEHVRNKAEAVTNYYVIANN